MKEFYTDKVMCMRKLIEKMEADAEEYGALHSADCPCNMEEPDECDCEEMKAIKTFAREWMEQVDAHWVAMTLEHRPYCSPKGNRMITRILGRKNRTHKEE